MRLVAALGGNALLERGDAPDAAVQAAHVAEAVGVLAPLSRDYQLVVTHGNGPQVGLLAVESADDPALTRPYPFDVLGAETQGMIGYLLVQALENALSDHKVAGLITQTLVDADDPAFSAPTKFVGRAFADEDEARSLAERFGWTLARDGDSLRRVVASPEPLEILELATIERLIEAGVVVVCAGGGGVPVVRRPDGTLAGAQAVVDKDLAAALLAGRLGADALMLLTDVGAVELDFGTPAARAVRQASPGFLRAGRFPAGSMGPKVEAAARFVEATGKRAMIGRLRDAPELLSGARGTLVGPGLDAVVEPIRGAGRGTGSVAGAAR